MRFRAPLLTNGRTATGVEVPEEVVAGLGTGKRPKVKATIGDYTYRSSVASMGGVYMLGVSAEVRAATGVRPGDELEIEVVLDEEIREVAVPDDLAAALAGAADARSTFDRLSYSNQRRLVMAIDAAKAPETRQRRIEKTVRDLLAGWA